jgi:hypothetical protein
MKRSFACGGSLPKESAPPAKTTSPNRSSPSAGTARRGRWLAAHRRSYPERPLVALCPGCKKPGNAWPGALSRNRPPAAPAGLMFELVILGGPAERGLADYLTAELKGQAIHAAGCFSVAESAALLSRCSLLIGLDTGTTHLAAAVGVPCVVLQSANSFPGHWDPLGENHSVVRADVPCEGCLLQQECPSKATPACGTSPSTLPGRQSRQNSWPADVIHCDELTMNITPVILTYNEEPNIGPTLASLTWASRVVVVDSGSSDRTREIARSFANVAWFVREFDSHAAQWSYAIQGTSIDTRYILALDADMRPGRALRRSWRDSPNRPARLRWCRSNIGVHGRPLFGSIYPAQVRVFTKEDVRIEQRGHTQVFRSTALCIASAAS